MKKIVFYIPVIVFAAFYALLATQGIGAISPIVVAWLALFLIAGILLSKTIFWGALLGVLPAIHLIYMSTQETGQVVIIELPLGIVAFLYYAICCYCVYKKKNTKSSS